MKLISIYVCFYCLFNIDELYIDNLIDDDDNDEEDDYYCCCNYVARLSSHCILLY